MHKHFGSQKTINQSQTHSKPTCKLPRKGGAGIRPTDAAPEAEFSEANELTKSFTYATKLKIEVFYSYLKARKSKKTGK
ncbi:MAG: hypothetical protein ACK4VN_04815 [Bacteroidales bacterium]